MACRVLFSVDVELTWRVQKAGGSWQDNLAASFDPAGVGIPYQLNVLDRHGLKGCFFVDSMPALVHGIEPIRRMVAPILEAGQEVQLHLHPFWADLADGREPIRFEMNGMSVDAQKAMIATARDLLIEAGAPSPTAFRAGSFAADACTLIALRELGLRYDSSQNGSYQPWPSALPLDGRALGPTDQDGVIELPVGQIEQAHGRLRHLQLCAVSFTELRGALIHAAASGHPLTTLVSHSFELATRDGKRANRVVQSRFERLCAFLEEQSATFRTVHVADLENLPLNVPCAPLGPDRLRTARRVASQAWADARHEKPGPTATAAGGAGMGSLELLLPLIGI